MSEPGERGGTNLTSLLEWNGPPRSIKGDVILYHEASPPCDVTALRTAQPTTASLSVNNFPPPLCPEHRAKHQHSPLKRQRTVCDSAGEEHKGGGL